MDKVLDDRLEHIEIDQLDGLIAAAGVDGAREILNAFWRSTQELLDALAAQVNDGSLDLASRTAHAIKGMAANVGASKLAQAASDLEKICKGGDVGAAPALMQETRARFETAHAHLLGHLQDAGQP